MLVFIAIYAADVKNIFPEKNEKTCYKILEKIKHKFEMEKGQEVSVEQFCEYTGVKLYQALYVINSTRKLSNLQAIEAEKIIKNAL